MQLKKADKNDLKTFDRQLSVIQKEMSHMIILMTENIKLHLFKAGDTTNSKENRALELISQM